MQQTSQSAIRQLAASKGQVEACKELLREGVEPSAVRCEHEQPCPQCGYPMSDLRGGREAICRNCGFKESCCY